MWETTKRTPHEIRVPALPARTRNLLATDSLASIRLSAGQCVDLGVFGEPAELFLGKGKPPVDSDFENAADPFDELDLLGTPL